MSQCTYRCVTGGHGSSGAVSGLQGGQVCDGKAALAERHLVAGVDDEQRREVGEGEGGVRVGLGRAAPQLLGPRVLASGERGERLSRADLERRRCLHSLCAERQGERRGRGRAQQRRAGEVLGRGDERGRQGKAHRQQHDDDRLPNSANTALTTQKGGSMTSRNATRARAETA